MLLREVLLILVVVGLLCISLFGNCSTESISGTIGFTLGVKKLEYQDIKVYGATDTGCVVATKRITSFVYSQEGLARAVIVTLLFGLPLCLAGRKRKFDWSPNGKSIPLRPITPVPDRD